MKADGQHYFQYSVKPETAPGCTFNSFGPIARDLRAGELVTGTQFLPRACRGVVRGEVRYTQPGPDSRDEQLPFMSRNLNDGVLVGRYVVSR